MSRGTIAMETLICMAALGCGGEGLPATGPSPYAYVDTFSNLGIYSVLSGNDTPTLLVGLPSAGVDDIVGAFFFDGVTAYYSDEVIAREGVTSITSSLRAVPVTGGAPNTLVTGVDNILGIVVDSDSLYFIDYYVDPQGTPSSATSFIGKAPRTGGSFQKIVPNPTAQPNSLAVAEGFIYWTDVAGSINRVSTAGGEVETLLTGQGALEGIRVDSSGIYWINLGTVDEYCPPGDTGGSIQALASGGHDPVTVASGVNDVSSLVVFHGVVYASLWNGCGSYGELLEAQPSTNPGRVVIGGLSDPGSLFLHGNLLYYTTLTYDVVTPCVYSLGDSE